MTRVFERQLRLDLTSYCCQYLDELLAATAATFIFIVSRSDWSLSSSTSTAMAINSIEIA